MARPVCQTNGLSKIEGDDVEKSLELLDKVLSEFEEPDSLPHIEPESPSQGNQSEDDGYMSMNCRRAKIPMDFHNQPSDDSSSSPPLREVHNIQQDQDIPDAKTLPPPPEVAEVILSNFLPRASPTNNVSPFKHDLVKNDVDQCIYLTDQKIKQDKNSILVGVHNLSKFTTINGDCKYSNEDDHRRMERHCEKDGEVRSLINDSTTHSQTTLPKARTSAAIPARYASLPCSGPARSFGSFDGTAIKGMSSGSFDGCRNILGIGISAVHDAVLRGGVARLPDPIVNEHPVTIYPGRVSPTRSRVPPRTLPGSIERHREVCRTLNSSDIDTTTDYIDNEILSNLNQRLNIVKSPSSTLVIMQTLNNGPCEQAFINNNIQINSRKRCKNHDNRHMNSESEEFSDDSLEGQSLPPPPLPPIVPPSPSLSAPVTPNKRSSIAWEINLEDNLPPPPNSQQNSNSSSGRKKKSYNKEKCEKAEILPVSASKAMTKKRTGSISESLSSVASISGHSTSSLPKQPSSKYNLPIRSDSTEWPEPPEPPICSTEDEATSIYSDSDEIISSYPKNLTGHETYVIRKGRRERERLPDFNNSDISTKISCLNSKENLQTIKQNMNLVIPKSRHSVDLGTSNQMPLVLQKQNSINSPRSRLSLDLGSPNSANEISQIKSITLNSNGHKSQPQSSSPRYADYKPYNLLNEGLDFNSRLNNNSYSHLNGSSNSLNNCNGTTSSNGSLTRISSLPRSMDTQNIQNDNITTPRRELAPPIEEDEEQDSESRGAPLREIENNISALLRGDISVARINEVSHPRRPLGFRTGVHKSESAKEMLLSQNSVFGPLPPSPALSSPEMENDGFPPLPPSPKEITADDECDAEDDVIHGMHNIRINSRTRLKSDILKFSRDKIDNLMPPPAVPVVPPHRGTPSLNTLRTRSMDGGYTKKYSSSSSSYKNGPGTLPSDLPVTNSRRRLMSGAFPKRLVQSPREEKRLQTSCSLPETPIFARGCDIPRTPHRRTLETQCNGGSRTAPRNTPNPSGTLNSSILGIGNTLSSTRQHSISQALASGEMLRLTGGPARGWYPKQRSQRPVSTEHLDRLHRSQVSMRAWESTTGGNRKPLTLPPNITPKFFNKSPREALRRVTSLLIRKGHSKEKESKKEKEDFITSAIHRSPGSAGDLPIEPTINTDSARNGQHHKKKSFFKSFWKKSKHYSLDQ